VIGKVKTKQYERTIEEAIYLLFVKASTLPVWLAKYRPTPEATGTTVVSTLGLEVTESKGKQLVELMFQVDVYCSEAEGISMEEIEYIDHMLKQAKKEKLEINGLLLKNYEMEQIVDDRKFYKMAPDGFERVMMWGRLALRGSLS
jgi:hypothetical protein